MPARGATGFRKACATCSCYGLETICDTNCKMLPMASDGPLRRTPRPARSGRAAALPAAVTRSHRPGYDPSPLKFRAEPRPRFRHRAKRPGRSAPRCPGRSRKPDHLAALKDALINCFQMIKFGMPMAGTGREHGLPSCRGACRRTHGGAVARPGTRHRFAGPRRGTGAGPGSARKPRAGHARPIRPRHCRDRASQGRNAVFAAEAAGHGRGHPLDLKAWLVPVEAHITYSWPTNVKTENIRNRNKDN